MTQLISPTKFTDSVGLLRSFFMEKGFKEVHTQNRLSILATLNGSSQAANIDNLFCVCTSLKPLSKKNDLKRPTVLVNFVGDIN